jgi:crotonobetainyl-CoA:carnitine CoA-transferase CaiB-like acyl-CoA transferase
VYGELLLAAPPWKMSGTPARWKSGCRPPGSDNRDVYLGILGMPEEEYRRLAEAGTI